ncbi:cobyric acid synthase [Candidatus Methanoplasma termitum]|uniref:Probable cobyric acid synthase n=1 Tax=Candidatus Methanoplasma termitum TaxID=1577791 RepID=A0A0A7LC23_9ARCH|nr:cobyric acid synthase [Candidatus Methanoplasma termitum]AIZ56553.1 cobyric acid synthase [Candidatus Methanoplasma termitum]MCL2333187.1 cobyric acid synthase [Candidatus Methanoplasma sp.]
MKKVIFLGTSSGAGKTTVTALYCRYLKREGISVAPFKASNLALNSFVTKNGNEIGTGQAFQAWVSGIEPTSEMNPVLLKPCGNGIMQLVVNGRIQGSISDKEPMDRKAVMKSACEAFDRLSEKYDAVVCEGSGSPAELNLMERDIANIGMMRERNIPAILIGDIERGGVFAALYGTWLLMPEDVRPLLKGFIINRFRGDPTILDSAIQKIKELTGMEFIGTIPYVDLKFPEEDSLSNSGGRLEGPNLVDAFIANADSLLETSEEYGLDLKKIDDISSA